MDSPVHPPEQQRRLPACTPHKALNHHKRGCYVQPPQQGGEAIISVFPENTDFRELLSSSALSETVDGFSIQAPEKVALIQAANRIGYCPTRRDFVQLIAQNTPRIVECGNDKMVYTAAKRHIALHAYTHYKIDTSRWLPVIGIDMDDRDPLDLIMGGHVFPFPAWVVYNNDNGHAQAFWVLEDPVTRGFKGRRAENAYWLVRDSLSYLIGGDPSHTNTVARTPYHDSHTWYPVLYRRWGLTELLGMLPTDAVARTANAAYRRTIDPSGGRNCGLYTWIRHWAYQEAREGRYAQLTLAHIRQTTDRRNQTFEDPLPMGEVRTISASVYKWMQNDWWGNRSDTPNAGSTRSKIHSSRRDPLTSTEARERIQAAQAQGAQTRREATREAITQAVGQLVGSGQRVTRKALQQLTGLAPKTLTEHADIWKR